MTHYVPPSRCAKRPSSAEPLARAASYRGSLKDASETEAASLLREALAYFGLDRPGALPASPLGTRGDQITDVDVDVLAVMRCGVAYLDALAGRKAQAQVGRYLDAAALLNPLADSIFEARRTEVIAASGAAAEQATREAEEAARVSRARAEQLVYFIGGEDGPIKIGLAKDPERRLRALQTSHPTRLEVLATAKGGFFLERKYHARFAADRLEGEWFTRSRPVRSEIARLTRGAVPSPLA
jgi:hypothetical protein